MDLSSFMRLRPLGFQETLRHGFLALAKSFPKRCVVIDGNRDDEAIASEIAAHL